MCQASPGYSRFPEEIVAIETMSLRAFEHGSPAVGALSVSVEGVFVLVE